METDLDLMICYSLRMGANWKVDEIRLDADAQRVDIYISYVGDRLICPVTGETGTLYDYRKERSWRHVDWFQFPSFVHCRVPRVKSSKGVNAIRVPWSSDSPQNTEAFESWMNRLHKAMRS
ncbi:MAG: transposase family protein [Bacteroidota bacterium]|nr:transposase family protein [Bacteroidota bacterium]MDE2956099.1 transposase family protein [Bacteroidota bacterium]